jgi:small subunit ribosomal protein S9
MTEARDENGAANPEAVEPEVEQGTNAPEESASAPAAESPAPAESNETTDSTVPEATGSEGAPDESTDSPEPQEPQETQETPEPAESQAAGDEAAQAEEEPAVRTLVELGAEARYSATGKRKSSVARVIIRPGSGQFNLNGHSLDEYFPRRKHQAVVRQPLDVAGYLERIDVRARVHGGGVSGPADAVRHGIAKALIEADPHLRGELKRRQLLTRDPRVKERRKAGLKKARKRPQFSKR